MTIEEENRYTNACIKYLQKNMECVGYRDYIIERLNKYQKIEDIYYHQSGEALENSLRWVIEDGNVD